MLDWMGGMGSWCRCFRWRFLDLWDWNWNWNGDWGSPFWMEIPNEDYIWYGMI